MTVSYLKALSAGLLAMGLIGCNEPAATPHSNTEASIVYINGQIISVNDNMGTVEAIAVKDGRIIALGSNSDMPKYQGEIPS